MSTKLAAATQKTAGIGNGMRTATVAAVSGSAVTLSINGGLITSGVGVLDSYIPVVGDIVAVFRQDSSWLVMGAIGTSIGPQPRATQTGTVPISVVNVDNLVVAITFPVAFAAVPIVVANLNTTAGAARPWTTKVFGTTRTGASLWFENVTSAALSTFTANAEWVATATA